MKMLTPDALLDRLVDRFTLLTRDSRDVPPRLKTMRDAVSWSYDLLSDDERKMFRRLSVFAGGCTIEAAESVCRQLEGPATEAKHQVFDSISSLLDKSLMIRIDDRPDHQPRFGMLETIRAYGLELLEAHGEADSAHDALTAWLVESTMNAFPEDFGPRGPYWSNYFEAEHANLRVALGWGIHQGDAAAVGSLIVAAVRFWNLRGYFVEGRTWTERALQLDLASAGSRVAGQISLSAAWIRFYEGVTPEMLSLAEHALELLQRGGSEYELAQAHNVLGLFTEWLGDFDRARRSNENALVHYLAAGDANWPPFTLTALGHTAYEQGNTDEATEYFDEALAAFRAQGNTYGEGIVLTNLAKVARRRGEYNLALDLFQKALASRWEHQDQLGLLGCLRGQASVFVLTSRYDEAACLDGAGEALRKSIGAPMPVHRARYDAAMATARAHLGDDGFDRAWQIGHDTRREAIVSAAIDGTLAALLPDDLSSASRSDQGLTPREVEVLALIRGGLSNREIGEQLYISERTAQTHVQHILDKLDVSTRAAAAAFAIEHELI
jgi:DNA-binding NarL/FixJ family response regulator